jgi:hypothetical protein
LCGFSHIGWNGYAWFLAGGWELSIGSTVGHTRAALALPAVLAALAVFSPSSADAAMITVQPIRVCDNGGSACANASGQLYEAYTDKIWAQAGIDVLFLPWVVLDNSSYLSVGSESLGNLFLLANYANTISMFFVHEIASCASATAAYGCSELGGDDIAIADLIFSENRVDTIAHEIGHNLGLSHCNSSGCGSDSLEYSGGRKIPTSLNDVAPDGKRWDKLSDAEIAKALASPLVKPTPEPGSFALVIGGVALAGVYTRRNRRRRVS